MKLCVSSTGPAIDATVDPAFGRALYFLVVETDSLVLEVVENTAASGGQGAGIAAAQLISDKGVDGLLTGYVGPHAFQALHAAGIKIFEGATHKETVREAIAKFNKGEYPEVSAPSGVPGWGPGRGRGIGRRMGGGRGKCKPS